MKNERASMCLKDRVNAVCEQREVRRPREPDPDLIWSCLSGTKNKLLLLMVKLLIQKFQT